MSVDLTSFSSLVSAVRDQVHTRPDGIALTFLHDPDRPRDGGTEDWSYARLDQEARTRAAWLQDRLAPGSRVLLLHPNGTEFAAAFYGCLYANMIAVPAPVPGRRRGRERVARISGHCEASAVLTTAANLGSLREWAAETGIGIPIVAGDAEPLAGPTDWRPVDTDRSAIAFLQYTSGSTGDPKGVKVSHDNALWNGQATARSIGWPDWMRMGGWLPLYHDMGLVQLLYSTVLGGGCALMEPSAFIGRPARWLQAVDALDIHVGFSPSFGYDLCVRKVTDEEVSGLDLSRWHVAGNGSEPVDPAVMRAFSKKFAPAGFRPENFAPVYGLAECTVYVSGRRDRSPVVRTLDLDALTQGDFVPAENDRPGREAVSVGPPTDACEVLVVEPETREVLPEGRLGEIWLRGRSVSLGYWERPDPEGRVFGATTADGRTGFLRTGDLGAFQQGELFVQGRIKDLLIVRGRNVFPADIEHELRARFSDLGRVGAVFAAIREDDPGADDAGAIVITHEVDGIPSDRLPKLAAELRHLVIREFGVDVASVLLLPAGTVARTTSGKVRRSEMRERFREGRLQALYPPTPAA